jgi:uncharacterized damage-inducible protein DinB
MKIDDIRLMYEYNYWADHRILATCERVSTEQYIAKTDYGCLRASLVHIMDAQRAWRLGFQQSFVASDALKDAPPAVLWDYQELTEADIPTLDDLKVRWQAEEQAMRTYLNDLTDQDMNGYIRYMIPGGIVRERILWHCLLHVINHGTQHRGEAAALLTSYGQSPGELDITVFLNEYFNLPSPPETD